MGRWIPRRERSSWAKAWESCLASVIGHESSRMVIWSDTLFASLWWSSKASLAQTRSMSYMPSSEAARRGEVEGES